jgi:uncharacterized protein (TIGR02145 family)
MKNNSYKLFFLFLLLIFLIVPTTCKKLEKRMLVSTGDVSNISTNSADATGDVIDLGGGATQYGHCYATTPNVTVSVPTKTQLGVPPGGGYTSQLTNLTAGTKYYIKAYISNGTETVYGKEINFTTVVASLPTLTTTVITSITTTTAISGGNISSDGGALVTARGVCWNTATGPSTDNNKTTDGSDMGSFVSNLTGLIPGTAYYVRAYATNSAGTNYGNEQTFTSVAASTAPGTPTIGTATAGNAQAIVTFTAPVSNGGSAITGYTVTSSPGNITGTGSSSPITVTGLTNGTAYTFTITATNAIGTSVASSASNSVTPLSPITDIDGNSYIIVIIGTQTWMAENLKTTKYNDGTTIPNITDNTAWNILASGAYSDYNNTPSNSITYGRLYNWYAVDNNAATKVVSNGGKNVCPTGWHVPSNAEWTTLTAYLGGETVAGGKLKETGTSHWITPNTGATNETGFTALPGSYRYGSGAYDNIGIFGVWWSSTEYSTSVAWYWGMSYNNTNLSSSYNGSERSGFSVRCIRDF